MRLDSGRRLGEIGVQIAQDGHPDFDVLPLSPANLAARCLGQIFQVPILDPNEFRLAQREVEMEVDQTGESRSGESDCPATARPRRVAAD